MGESPLLSGGSNFISGGGVLFQGGVGDLLSTIILKFTNRIQLEYLFLTKYFSLGNAIISFLKFLIALLTKKMYCFPDKKNHF